jgi:hypothetical protein
MTGILHPVVSVRLTSSQAVERITVSSEEVPRFAVGCIAKEGFMMKVSLRLSLVLVAIAFIAAACGSSAATSTSSPASTPQPMQTMTMMHLPAYAQNMKY